MLLPFFHRLCSFRIPALAARLLPGLFFYTLILFLISSAHAGSAAKASVLQSGYFQQNLCCFHVDAESPAPEKQSEWSLTWIEKNDLQEHLLRRGETTDIYLCMEQEDWPISKVISLSDKPGLPVLKKIFLRYKFIRAGPFF